MYKKNIFRITFYEGNVNTAGINNEKSKKFATEMGLKQGCLLLFTLVTNKDNRNIPI